MSSRIRLSNIRVGAQRWLIYVDIPETDVSSHLQRLFAVAIAGKTVGGRINPRTIATLKALATQIKPFSLAEVDPFSLMLAVSVLRPSGVTHASINEGVRNLIALLETERFAPREFDLIRSLVVRWKTEQSRDSAKVSRVEMPLLRELLLGDRDSVLEFCRLAMSQTSFGTVRVDSRALGWLPSLALSYAMDGDMNCVNALVRCCLYYRVVQSKSFGWSVEWLMDQQQSDGRIGAVVATGDETVSHRRDVSFGPTVDLLWTTQELLDCGFLIR